MLRGTDHLENAMAAKTGKQAKNSEKTEDTLPLPPSRMSVVINDALDRIDENLDQIKDTSEHWKKIRKVLKKKDKEKILEVALENYYNSEELKPYQAELIKLQKHLERTGKKMIVLFDGRDASGKGGTIRRVTRYMNEKHYRIVAMGKPSHIQRTELHMKRYIEQFPRSGEIVLFDRSWYNRAMVEPVMGFCTDEQHKRFLKDVSLFEELLVKDGITLFKFYFSVSKDEQSRRFNSRKSDPLKQYKLSPVDNLAQKYWDQYSVKKFQMLNESNRTIAPWTIIRSDDKKKARVNCMKHILGNLDYAEKLPVEELQTEPAIVISGIDEIKHMEKNLFDPESRRG